VSGSIDVARLIITKFSRASNLLFYRQNAHKKGLEERREKK